MDSVFRHYWTNRTCEDLGRLSFSKERLEEGYCQSRDKILLEARRGYDKQDYLALRHFFFVALPAWAADGEPVLLFPCYAEKVEFRGNPAWVVCLNWEVVHYEKGTAALSHIFVMVVDGKTGAILETRSCD